ncbi:MAG: c-type cytochrome [Gallionella sp.]|nr:c-type cytochrome [Gallionella sp.]MDD4958546.1 c-type cytochrome [Gallionella sp.]
MKKVIVGMAVVGLFAASSAMAIDLPKDAQSKCGACHKMSGKAMGPSWEQMAEKYKGKADAEKTLVTNITAGGKFGWSMGNMPAKGSGASAEQIALFAKFIAVDMNAAAK